MQELQIWVQALNGGTSAFVHPRNWENPVLGIQSEQQKSQWEELSQLCNQIWNQYHGLKDLTGQENFDRLRIETLEEKYWKFGISTLRNSATGNSTNIDISQFEQGVEDQFEHHEASIKGVGDHSYNSSKSQRVQIKKEDKKLKLSCPYGKSLRVNIL